MGSGVRILCVHSHQIYIGSTGCSTWRRKPSCCMSSVLIFHDGAFHNVEMICYRHMSHQTSFAPRPFISIFQFSCGFMPALECCTQCSVCTMTGSDGATFLCLDLSEQLPWTHSHKLSTMLLHPYGGSSIIPPLGPFSHGVRVRELALSHPHDTSHAPHPTTVTKLPTAPLARGN